jgi:titin
MVSWKPPASDGGSPVTGYRLEQKLITEARWTPVTPEQVTDTEYKVDKLKTGNEYQFRVAAVNLAGAGKWSQPSDEVLCKAPVGKEFGVISSCFTLFSGLA